MGEEIEIFMAEVFKRFRQPNATGNSEATKSSATYRDLHSTLTRSYISASLLHAYFSYIFNIQYLILLNYFIL